MLVYFHSNLLSQSAHPSASVRRCQHGSARISFSLQSRRFFLPPKITLATQQHNKIAHNKIIRAGNVQSCIKMSLSLAEHFALHVGQKWECCATRMWRFTVFQNIHGYLFYLFYFFSCPSGLPVSSWLVGLVPAKVSIQCCENIFIM